MSVKASATKAPVKKAPVKKAPAKKAPSPKAPAKKAPADKLPPENLSAATWPAPRTRPGPPTTPAPTVEPPVATDEPVAAAGPGPATEPAVRPVSASDVPVRAPGVRTRSGNAMGRTRGAVLEAALECVARYGVRRTTMTDVISRSRVAKGTLYNHFRTKEDLLDALVEAQVTALGQECLEVAARASRRGDVAAGRAAALAHAATTLSSSRALRRLASDEPALLAALAAPGEGRGWEAARAGVTAVLALQPPDDGQPLDQPPPPDVAPEHVELVLRWLAAHLSWPGSPERSAAQAALLAATLERGAGG